ncbi:MAG: hypothetical protein F6K11_02655 [Leptolyngbya sp. SIO3F4]|nr:hypothetical protein [Leptolyngbya sp. SIO3F4]
MKTMFQKVVCAVMLTALFMPFSRAQEPSKQREAGITFSSLNSFGITYRFGNEKAMWRINSLIADYTNSESENSDQKRTLLNVDAVVSFGREYRTQLTDRFDFRYGADVSFRFQLDRSELEDKTGTYSDPATSETLRYAPGINAVLGFNYAINDHFLVGAEFMPGIRYSIGTGTDRNFGDTEDTTTDLSDFSARLNSTSGMLSLVYRF